MCESHNYCYVEMPTGENKVIEYKQSKKSQKSKKAPFIIFSDLECLLKTNNDQNNDQNNSIAITNHIPCGYSMYTHCSFDSAKNNLDFYRGKYCMKEFADTLKDQVSKVISYEKKELIKLTEEKYENHKNQKLCYICSKIFFYL